MKTKLLFSTLALLVSFQLFAQFQTNVNVANEHFHDLNTAPTDDGSDDYIVAGNLFDATMTTQQMSLKRIDQTGNVVWAQRYDSGALPNARIFDIEVYFDLIFVTGSVDVGGIKRTFVAEMDAISGSLINSQYYDIVSPNFNSRGLNIVYTNSDADGDSVADPGFVISGFFSGCYNVDINCANNIGFVMRVDFGLNLIWTSEIDTAVPSTVDYDFANNVTETSDGFFITGSATGLNSTNVPQQGVLAHKIDLQGNWMWDQSYLFGNSRDVSVDAYFDAGSQKIYMLTNYSQSHYFGVTVYDNATGAMDPVRSWYANASEYNRYGFSIIPSLTSPNNLVITGYDRDQNWTVAGTTTALYGESNVFVYEFEKATGNAVAINQQYLVPHTEPTGDEFNFWNAQMPLIYYPDMSFTMRTASGTVDHYFHVGYRRNTASSFTAAELFKTPADKRNECEQLPIPILHNGFTPFPIQVSSGMTPTSQNPLPLTVNGYNYTMADCSVILSTGDAEINTGTIFPNPVSDVLYTSVLNAQKFTIFDATGRKVAAGRLSTDNSIQTQELSNGMYFLTITDDSQRAQSFKFIKK